MYKPLIFRTITQRKLKHLYKYLFIYIALFFSFTSQAIVIRHDVPDKHYQDLATPYSASVAYLDLCLSTVLSEYWLITAAHCVSKEQQYPLQVSHLGMKYPVEEIVLNPHSAQFDDLDIALIRLKWPLKKANAVAIYSHNDELGKQVVFVGKGLTGNGLTGDEIRDKIERAATNTVTKVEANWLSFTFNPPESATEFEGVSGAEDSGGPAFILTATGLKLAGVGCCQEPVIKSDGEELQGGYLSTEYYSRLSPHRDWIVQQMNRPIISESAKSPVLQALSYNQLEKVKRLLIEDKLWLNQPQVITEALIYAFFRSNELCHFLLTQFPELREHKIKGMPLTAYAYMQGSSEVLSLLIKLGVAMDYTGFKGQQLPSLLSWQYFNDDYRQQLDSLLKQGLDINRSDDRGDTALHMAIYFGSPQRVNVLLDLGADINQVDIQGNSALIDAARIGNLAIIKQLLARGADIALLNQQQKNAEAVASEAGFVHIAKYLNSVARKSI
jgi:hypothetical protein